MYYLERKEVLDECFYEKVNTKAHMEENIL